MKCPNCGAEIKEGTFYCENCGHDIHIVPDFEPELEFNMQKSLEQVFESVSEPEKKEKKEGTSHKKQPEKTTGGIKYYFIGGISILLVAGIICGGVRIYHNNSMEYQLKKALQAVDNGLYDKAIDHYTRAIELDRRNVDLKFGIAEVYFLMDNMTEYEQLLNSIVDDPYTDAEQLESAYRKLIAIYKAREDYQKINEILLNCDNESIKTAYQGYLAQPPEFSIPGGTYNSMTALKLTVPGQGCVYYTLNGADPDENSEQYRAPILLEKGKYTVKAFYINENGVASEVVTAEYEIEAEELEMPEINVDGGDYNVALFITVMNDTDNIYYTTDGSEPTMDSQQYTEPIPMPLGESIFRFVRIEAGLSSGVVDRAFYLKLDTDLTTDQAVAKIVDYNLQAGKITDREGHYDGTGACYQYQYLYVANINDISDFYVIGEILVDSQGASARTGNYFAVNAYTGYCYKLQIEHHIYTLTEIN